MSLNLLGKYRYLTHTLSFYPDGLKILVQQRLLGQPITRLRMKNGLVIYGAKRSLLVDVVDEIFSRQGYIPRFLPIKPGDVVLDIGANIGVFSLFAATKKAGKIYAVEPLKENIRLISRNFKANKLPLPVIIRSAVAAKIGRTKFYLGKFDPHGSLFGHGDYLNVPTTTLGSILSRNHIKRVDFLKIDAEGSEGEIVLSTPAEVWQKVRKISLEYHDNLSLVKHKDLIKKLQGEGFKTRLVSDDSPFGYIYARRK